MTRIDTTDDFEALIRIYSTDEGGRQSPVFNGIRWDFAYADQDPRDGIHMIHPDFMDEHGNSRTDNAPLPVGEHLPARMTIVVDEMRQQVHRGRITPGLRFYCHEGGKRVAEGMVTKITWLHLPRDNNTPLRATNE